ncbi:hypothetical protein EV44_g3823 [Erysiphe necator]|uniref:Uncharacterized protein n=1 Tax=Uncinula necator TaxID=52586 RepID=A0A0B1P8X8_UNCNE|nr:hypothetical protein EV44_g3823 [Erysiphe necator]
MSSEISIPITNATLMSSLDKGLNFANTIDEILHYCCPKLFKPALKEFLKRVYDTKLKKEHLDDAITKVDNLNSKGVFSPQNEDVLKRQRIQFSGDIDGCSQIYDAQGEIKVNIVSTKRESFDIFVSAKKTELDIHRKTIATGPILEEIRKQVVIFMSKFVPDHIVGNMSKMELDKAPSLLQEDYTCDSWIPSNDPKNHFSSESRKYF